MKTLNRLLLIFIGAFVLNLIWEHLHSVLYVSYQGGVITNTILIRAAAFDAAVIAFFSFPFFRFDPLWRQRCLLYVALAVFAVILEWWALATGRWVYADIMPLVPILHVGLTPAIQLGLLGYVAVRIANNFHIKKTGPRESVSLEQSEEL